MKSKLTFITICFLLTINIFANQLSCQIVNLATNRIVDQKISDYPSNNKPILIILGVGELMGTVKDIGEDSVLDRDLMLQFSYGFPGSVNSNGLGTSFAHYNREQEITNKPLAEVEMTDPQFPIVYSLQCLLIK